MEGFDKERVGKGIEFLCAYFDDEGFTMAERWYVCLCIERSCESIMVDGFKDAADSLSRVKEALGEG